MIFEDFKEEKLASPEKMSPKAKALSDRLLNQQQEKDESSLKLKVENRIAKADLQRAQIQQDSQTRLKQIADQHEETAAARQMEMSSRRAETAAKDREAQERAELVKAEQAAERAAEMAQREAKAAAARLARANLEEASRSRTAEKLKAMEERLTVFNQKRDEECNKMCENHLSRVARREALVDRMHAQGMVNADVLREEIEIRQEEAEAKRQQLIESKKEAARAQTKHAAEVAEQKKLEEDDILAQKKMEIENDQKAAARRRSEQQTLSNTARSPPRPKRSPPRPSPVKAAPCLSTQPLSPRTLSVQESSWSNWKLLTGVAIMAVAVGTLFRMLK